MGSGPPGSLLLLLLSSLLLILKCATGESSFIIDTVGLSILPKDNVQSGTEVKIRCDARVSSSNISQLGYLFEFMRDGVKIHTANTTEDSAYYEINPARAVDSGNYQCKVSVKNKRKFSNTKTLDVKGLQTPILHLNNSTPYESEEFKVTCSAPDEKGSLTFNFYKTFRDGQPQRIKKQRSTNNFLETTVTLSHIGDCFLSCDYEISLVSGPTSSNVSNEIQVKVKELNIVPYMTILPNDIYEPDIIEVTCKVQIHLADIEIFLLKDRAVLNRTTGKPLIHRFRPKPTDSGELICKTEWRNVQKENYKTLKVKEVFSKPQLHLEPVDVFEGERFRLNCSVKVFFPQMFDPKTLKYHLYKDGTQLISSATYVAVADRNRNGIYSCKVEGTRISTSFHKESETVTVKAKVPVSDPVLNVVGGKIFVGKGFQLICHSHTGTFPIVYTLFTHNGKKMIRKVSRSEDQATFDVPPIHKTSDLKAFLCHASNNPRTPSKTALGQKLLNSTNIIEPTSKPQLTIQPSQDITEGQSMKLVCSVQAGSRPINFTWYQESSGALASLSTNKLEGYHSMSNAHKKHSGKYYCTSSNPADEPKQSEPVTVEVKMAGWKKALIIVFCFILLLILFLVIALKTRLFHFKRKRTANLSVKSVSTKLERLSLTQAEVIDANATPTMMGKSVWSDHVSGSGGYESDDQNSSTLPEKQAEPEYTEVQIKDADPTKAPAKQSTGNIYSEVRHSQQGVPEVPDGKPVEYAQLNHDGNHQPDDGQVVDQSLTRENTTDSENNTDVHTGDPEEGTCDLVPDC